MKQGDKIIWNSGFGYDIGYFISESDDVMYNSLKINLVTGIAQGDTLRSRDEILPYTDENIESMISKYNYEKKWSKEF
jgi:hypothetical protein